MSGGFITGEIAMPDSDSEEYVRGENTAVMKTADRLAGAFMRISRTLEMKTTIYSTYDEGRDLLLKEIEACLPGAGEQFDHNAFLDALTSKLVQGISASEAIHLGCLLDPLVQELYLRGWNNLTIDLSMLPVERVAPFALGGDAPWFIGYGLTGTIERPLALTYRGDVHNIGEEASYCRLTLEGKCAHAGSKADHSSLVLKETYEAGERAKGCRFELERADSLAYMAENCAFYVKDLSGKDLDERWRWWIPAYGCSLHIPDKHGGWAVVER